MTPTYIDIIKEADALQEKLVAHRRYIHQNAEVHMDLPITSSYVIEQLTEMGYEPVKIGSSGVLATLSGNGKGSRTFLIRGDMDALPIPEESDLDFKSQTGNMHACGHDFHTAMMLGAAQLLKKYEDHIPGQIKLMFQPAEETLSGAKMMIENGILENPQVDGAMMIHVETGNTLPVGTIIALSSKTVNYTACDWFTIRIQGTGCHGAAPEAGVDPLNVLSHIHIGLQAINARETAPSESIALTIGQMHGGNTSNVVPDTGYMTGTLRTTNEKTRTFAKQRLEEIAIGIAQTFRAQAEVEFERGCPNMVINEELTEDVKKYCRELAGENMVIDIDELSSETGGLGSEDFAYVSQLVPSTCLSLAAGSSENGYVHPVHHPKVQFDEDALARGVAVYAYTAMRWLEDHSL